MLLSTDPSLALHVRALHFSVGYFKDKAGKQWPLPPEKQKEAAPSCPLLRVPPSSVLCRDTQQDKVGLSLARLGCSDAVFPLNTKKEIDAVETGLLRFHSTFPKPRLL